ncbi:MAG TPA: ATP-binding protein [Bosea sp. (in: a-proteobacteria)]|jgi:C4-dicarboxylate-specific signal transduction histidine kinase|uniref:sensor histidine kinase n=1 Tax=Bosea sp. (in: a-proteobacteria) TaxID=1871050 RepID=UPI002E0D8A4E|nr:ATP-binding protein [Bosea sp. (in: a-proteobacteria)]
MRQVFSRWPSLAESSAISGQESSLPAWMSASAPRHRLAATKDVACATLLILGPAAIAALAAWQIAQGDALAPWLGAIALVATGLALVFAARLMRSLRRSAEHVAAIFERAGISMWREDWTAAGEAVKALRTAGVTDLESYFASRPDELRALKAQVLIRDVNSFTLEETGAAGKEDYLGPLDRLLPETDQTFVQWLVAFGRGDRFFRSEAHITTATGREIDTLFTAMLPRDLAGFANIVVTSVDVTAYKQAQARLSAAETDAAKTSRMATANALSAAIAHEVNSPLAAILANAQAAQRLLRLPQPDMAEAGAALGDVVSQASRAKEVVARTTSYFSKATGDFAPVNLIDVARNANLLVENELRSHGAVVHLAAEDDLPLALVDAIQIQQVFVNLLVNAAQAMAGRAGKRDITLAIRSEGAQLVVDVADTGPGVAPERRATIFEPFRSSRPGGLGMGLAICRNCIDAHGGDIWVDPAPGGGAAFHFTVPIARG